MAERSAKQLGLSQADLPNSIIEVIATLSKSGFEAYIVGGGVRDTLLGLSPKDFDAVTDAKPHEIKDVFGKRCRIIGRRFQLAHVYSGRDMIEVATFRAPPIGDAHTTGDGMIVRDNVWGDIQQDFARRDFSINAMYYEPIKGVVHDFCNALDDIKNKVLRLLGHAPLRIEEDPVRLLRALRFKAKLGFDFDADLAAQFNNDNWALLEQVSPHRLYDESQKMFTGGYLVPLLPLLFDYGAIDHLVVYPPKEPTALVTQVAINTDKRIAQGKSINPAFFYAALLWENYLYQLNKNKNKKMPFYDAQQQAATQVINRQRVKTAIPKFAEQFIRDIWLLQPKLANPKVKQIIQLAEHPRFRAGFDFLLLREQCGDAANPLSESTNGMGEWWQTYQTLSDKQKQQAVDDFASDSRRAPSSKRNRNRKQSSIPQPEDNSAPTAQINNVDKTLHTDRPLPQAQRQVATGGQRAMAEQENAVETSVAGGKKTASITLDSRPIPAKRSRKKMPSQAQDSENRSPQDASTTKENRRDKDQPSTQENNDNVRGDKVAKRADKSKSEEHTNNHRNQNKQQQRSFDVQAATTPNYAAERAQLQQLSLSQQQSLSSGNKAYGKRADKPALANNSSPAPLFTIDVNKLAKQVPKQVAAQAALAKKLDESPQKVRRSKHAGVEEAQSLANQKNMAKKSAASNDGTSVQSANKPSASTVNSDVLPQKPAKPNASGQFSKSAAVPYKRRRRQPSTSLTQNERLNTQQGEPSDKGQDATGVKAKTSTDKVTLSDNAVNHVEKMSADFTDKMSADPTDVKKMASAKSTPRANNKVSGKSRAVTSNQETVGHTQSEPKASAKNTVKPSQQSADSASMANKTERVPATRRRRQPSSTLTVNERSQVS